MKVGRLNDVVVANMDVPIPFQDEPLGNLPSQPPCTHAHGDADAASVAHAYWQRHYAHKYERAGYRVITEAPRTAGRADLLALKASESVAIEVETGKSDAVHNVKQDLLSRFDKVIIVATSEAAYNKVELELARAGLFIPGRVGLVLRDQHAVR